MTRELTIDATVDHLEAMTDFVDATLEACGCAHRLQAQIVLAAEEIFVNIALYAYAAGTVGAVTVRVSVDREAVITFEDGGTPYNPLDKADPDISQDAEHREIGGLGVFMVKQIMDRVEYRHEAGKNILTMRKGVET